MADTTMPPEICKACQKVFDNLEIYGSLFADELITQEDFIKNVVKITGKLTTKVLSFYLKGEDEQ